MNSEASLKACVKDSRFAVLFAGEKFKNNSNNNKGNY